jgi:hypothetical protein
MDSGSGYAGFSGKPGGPSCERSWKPAPTGDNYVVDSMESAATTGTAGSVPGPEAATEAPADDQEPAGCLSTEAW